MYDLLEEAPTKQAAQGEGKGTAAWHAGGRAAILRPLRHALLQPQEGSRRALRVREEPGGQACSCYSPAQPIRYTSRCMSLTEASYVTRNCRLWFQA